MHRWRHSIRRDCAEPCWWPFPLRFRKSRSEGEAAPWSGALPAPGGCRRSCSGSLPYPCRGRQAPPPLSSQAWLQYNAWRRQGHRPLIRNFPVRTQADISCSSSAPFSPSPRTRWSRHEDGTFRAPHPQFSQISWSGRNTTGRGRTSRKEPSCGPASYRPSHQEEPWRQSQTWNSRCTHSSSAGQC